MVECILYNRKRKTIQWKENLPEIIHAEDSYSRFFQLSKMGDLLIFYYYLIIWDYLFSFALTQFHYEMLSIFYDINCTDAYKMVKLVRLSFKPSNVVSKSDRKTTDYHWSQFITRAVFFQNHAFVIRNRTRFIRGNFINIC